MLQPDINEGPGGPYEARQPWYDATTPSAQPAVQSGPAAFQQAQPIYRTEPPKSSSRGLRTGAIIALTVALLLVFGVGLFAGWQFAKTGTATTTTSVVSALQTGTKAQPTIPALSGNNIEAVREAV